MPVLMYDRIAPAFRARWGMPDLVLDSTVSYLDEAHYTRVQTDRQVMGAQTAIERSLGLPPVLFAYPYGRMLANLIASVMAYGLQVAYTTAGGAGETAGKAYLWPRVRIHSTTTAAGILWLIHSYRQMSPIRSRKRCIEMRCRTRSQGSWGPQRRLAV